MSHFPGHQHFLVNKTYTCMKSFLCERHVFCAMMALTETNCKHYSSLLTSGTQSAHQSYLSLVYKARQSFQEHLWQTTQSTWSLGSSQSQTYVGVERKMWTALEFQSQKAPQNLHKFLKLWQYLVSWDGQLLAWKFHSEQYLHLALPNPGKRNSINQWVLVAFKLK